MKENRLRWFKHVVIRDELTYENKYRKSEGKEDSRKDIQNSTKMSGCLK